MNPLERFHPIRAFALDVDGVLTDGSLLLTEEGQALRRMHIRDGYALQLAVKKGYAVVIISGGRSEAVRQRLLALGVTDLYLGVQDKKACLEEYLQTRELDPATLLYMGDDVPDYGAMMLAGLPTCPADACPEIRAISAYVSAFSGGHGCVRDVLEKVLKLHGDWEAEAWTPPQ